MRNFNNSYKLLAGALALIFVAGMTSPAFAGFESLGDCEIILNPMVNIQVAQNAQEIIPKEIDCDGPIIEVIIFSTTCQFNGIDLENKVLDFGGRIDFDEVIKNLDNTLEEHCLVVFEVENILGETEVVTQELWINVPKDKPIGGTSIPVSTTTLLVAGAQANMGLLSLALVGIVGAGAAIIYKVKSKKTEQ